MKQIVSMLMFLMILATAFTQKKTTSQIKSELQQAQNPVAYIRDVLKKKYKLDTVTITRIGKYSGIADSLGYSGQVRKVYGPFDKGKILLQVLGKVPNTFYRVSLIFLDTSIFKKKFADSLAGSIMQRIRSGTTTFEEMAQTYSMGGEGTTKGDLGWIARGVMLPEIEKELVSRKKGDVFKIWNSSGLYIIKKTENPKQDHGFALLMRVFL